MRREPSLYWFVTFLFMATVFFVGDADAQKEVTAEQYNTCYDIIEDANECKSVVNLQRVTLDLYKESYNEQATVFEAALSEKQQVIDSYETQKEKDQEWLRRRETWAAGGAALGLFIGFILGGL